MTPVPGQIWQENDSRFARLIKVVSVEGDNVFFRNYPHEYERRKTLRKAMLKRFNGQSHGYSFTGKTVEISI